MKEIFDQTVNVFRRNSIFLEFSGSCFIFNGYLTNFAKEVKQLLMRILFKTVSNIKQEIL